MCGGPKMPKIDPVPPYVAPPPAPPPEKTPESAIMNEDGGKATSTNNTIKAKRTGTSALRIDLSIPGTGQGLNVPQ